MDMATNMPAVDRKALAMEPMGYTTKIEASVTPVRTAYAKKHRVAVWALILCTAAESAMTRPSWATHRRMRTKALLKMSCIAAWDEATPQDKRAVRNRPAPIHM